MTDVDVENMHQFSPSNISSYASLSVLPPALSPDSSPTSVASSPWLRTPGTDPSLGNVASVDALWDSTDTKGESCSTIHFLDQSGNNLEDIPSQVQELMPEDIVCSPQTISDTSLPQLLSATPYGRSGSVTPTSNTPTFVISPPCASASTVEAVPLGPAHCTSFSPPSPHISQSLFTFSPVTQSYPRETPLLEYSASSSLSPLSTLSSFSQSPSVSPDPSPLTRYSSLSPAISPPPPSNGDERVGVTDSTSSTFARVTSEKSRGKRRAGTPDNDASPCKIPRRSNAKNVDEEEWNPVSVRVKRPRAVVSSESTRQTSASTGNCPLEESLSCETGQGSEGDSDAAHTSCEICGQGFTRTSDYIRHIENSASHPETRKVWPCPHCESTLGRKDALGRHIRTMHPGRPVVIPEGIPGSQKRPFVQRIGQRKMLPRRQPKKDTLRRYH